MSVERSERAVFGCSRFQNERTTVTDAKCASRIQAYESNKEGGQEFYFECRSDHLKTQLSIH